MLAVLWLLWDRAEKLRYTNRAGAFYGERLAAPYRWTCRYRAGRRLRGAAATWRDPAHGRSRTGGGGGQAGRSITVPEHVRCCHGCRDAGAADRLGPLARRGLYTGSRLAGLLDRRLGAGLRPLPAAVGIARRAGRRSRRLGGGLPAAARP
ncbi:hypothetical protein QYF50_09425 [Paenibacillus vini]|uniref:hypothetical protein n=1 Tax=Paenibacillus TaxID=44249 RepID=UPI001B37248D|nr:MULTISPECIES: hypothetical protein [Paenibacillus]MDN4068104.1 hypothetical protein [Paenibacillus vini]